MSPYPTLTSLALLFLTALGAVVCSDGTQGEVRTLVPVTRRSTGLGAREISRAGLRPRSEVWMPFGEGSSPIDQTELVYVVDIRISAHQDLPILLLEDFEDLASSISCTNDRPSSSLSIVFHEHSDFSLARSEWLSHRDGFVLISSHHSARCNPLDERGAYNVTRAECEESSLTCTLYADAIEWRQVGSGMKVKYGQVTPEAFHGGLVRRDLFSSDPLSISKQFPDRFSLWPPTGNSNISIPIIPTGFFATCVGCSFSGGLGVRGEFDLDLGLPPKIDKAWVEANTTKAIKALAKVEVILNASIPALPIPLIPEIFFTTWQIPKLFGLGPYFKCDLNLAFDLKAKKLNFTFGAEVEVPANSVARFDMVGNSSLARGWNQTKVNRLPFSFGEIDGPFDFGLNATLAPTIGFKVALLNDEAAAGPSIDFAAPRLVIGTKEVRNVTNLCKPVGPKDLTYYPKAVIVTALYELGISASLTAELSGLEQQLSVDIYTYTGPKQEMCLAFPGKPGLMLTANETQPVIDESRVVAAPGGNGGQPPRVGNDTQRNASTGNGTTNSGSKPGVVPMWVGITVGAVVVLAAS